MVLDLNDIPWNDISVSFEKVKTFCQTFTFPAVWKRNEGVGRVARTRTKSSFLPSTHHDSLLWVARVARFICLRPSVWLLCVSICDWVSDSVFCLIQSQSSVMSTSFGSQMFGTLAPNTSLWLKIKSDIVWIMVIKIIKKLCQKPNVLWIFYFFTSILFSFSYF